MAKTRSTNPRIIPEGRTQVNFNIKNELLEKVEDIAYLENTSKSEVYNSAVDKFIDLYEKKNGKLKVRQKGKGLNI